MTDAQIKTLIARGVADALAERDADRIRNDDDNHDSGGTEGVVGLTQWIEKMESLFHISNCTVTCQVKFATCTLQGNALTWWNSHVRTVRHDVAYAMPWKTLKNMMTDKYCLRGEIKKLEIKMWNLKVKGTDVLSYNQRFQELSLMCGRMFPEESDEVEKHVGGLLDMIHSSVMASKPKTMQDAIEFETELMDQKIRTIAEREGVCWTLSLCNKCKFHHNGPCTTKCVNCKRVGHLTQDYRSPTATNNQRTLTCYECRNQGHYRSDCPELKNQNHENQAGGTEARGMVYALGGGEKDQDLDDIEDNINA
ncbi:reverse transcriptase domain-containing protein [Tanacetum coccineum]